MVLTLKILPISPFCFSPFFCLKMIMVLYSNRANILILLGFKPNISRSSFCYHLPRELAELDRLLLETDRKRKQVSKLLKKISVSTYMEKMPFCAEATSNEVSAIFCFPYKKSTTLFQTVAKNVYNTDASSNRSSIKFHFLTGIKSGMSLYALLGIIYLPLYFSSLHKSRFPKQDSNRKFQTSIETDLNHKS